jgi:hypothetical protein
MELCLIDLPDEVDANYDGTTPSCVYCTHQVRLRRVKDEEFMSWIFAHLVTGITREQALASCVQSLCDNANEDD